MFRVSKFLCVSVSATALVLAGGYSESMAQSAGGAGAAAPATRPSAMPADQLLNQMLRPKDAAVRPLLPQPESDPRDVTSGRGSTAPGAPSMPLLREGTFVVDRTGRLSRSAAGAEGSSFSGHEFIFEADGRALRDPPMVVLPNLALQRMEDANKGSNRDLRFRVTGVVTEYRGRNAILIEKVVVIPDVVQQN